MQRIADEDSGHSTCSAGSLQVPVTADIHSKEFQQSLHKILKSNSITKEAGTNTELRISTRPRSCVGLLRSPNERDPFPSCRITRPHRGAVLSLFNSRKGGLTTAHSTIDIASSTQVEQPNYQTNPISLPCTEPIVNDQFNITFKENLRNHIRKPIQRAASRLYKADTHTQNKPTCVGPEFIVRAAQAVKYIDLPVSPGIDRKPVTIILLNGQRVQTVCDPNITTAGHIFEAIVRSEHYEHSFMLGIAVLVSGDFIFLPEEYKIKKVAPEGWYSKSRYKKKYNEEVPFTVFLRIKFFLPTNITKNIQGGEWRYRVYLQLRRSTVEGQLTSSLQNLILLAGYALHIEFGDFSYREHGTGDYFLLEHYLPEGSLLENETDVKIKMKRAHESRRGLERNKAIINYIALAQQFRDYGAHFYSAVWATRDGFCRDVWLSIGPTGCTLYSRNTCMALPQERFCGNSPNRIVLQNLPWHHVHTFYFNKKTLYIIPKTHLSLSKANIKYKLKLTDNKSYFTFWLASLHHRLYLKLYSREDILNNLQDILGNPLSDNSANDAVETDFSNECSNYQDSYNLAVRNPGRFRRPTKRRFRLEIFSEKKSILKNKENDKPSTEEILREMLAPQPEYILNESNVSQKITSSTEGLSSSESCSLPRRQGVKMGTKVFSGSKSSINKTKNLSFLNSNKSLNRSDGETVNTQSDSDDIYSVDSKLQQCNINSMKLLPERQYTSDNTQGPTAYVVESPRVYKDAFTYNVNESCISSTIFDKLDAMGCVQGERIFVTATLTRDDSGALGMQVAEGSDGNVYIKSITPNGSADLSQKLSPGDQIISVNGHTLLNVEYKKALSMLQAAPKTVELIVLHSSNKNIMQNNMNNRSDKAKSLTESIASNLEDFELMDEEVINQEALKTIYALIQLTKQNAVMRMKEKSNLSTANKMMLQKCLSENKVYDESDAGNYSSQESTPDKKQHFNTWRGRLQNRPKRRPLSLNIPADTELSESYINNLNNTNEKNFLENTLTNKTSMNKVQLSLQNLSNLIEETANKKVALPRNFGLSRKYVGPVRYPVTPCKNSFISNGANDEHTVKRHFVYGKGDSDEDQIFL